MTEKISVGSYSGSVEHTSSKAVKNNWVTRIWAKDPTLWKEAPEHTKIIENSLGWLTVATEMQKNEAALTGFVESVRKAGFRSMFLLGMGGSSLCPDVCAEIFGTKPGYLQLFVLDTTDPAGILAAEKAVDLAHTLFIVSSKSGGTIESSSLYKYFFERMRQIKGNAAGENFIAITDPGTSLEQLGKDQNFRRVFLNPKDIGGRYSALSYFGLVPMAFMGLDIHEILMRAIDMADRCRTMGDPATNPGLFLGIVMGALATEGLDKLTFSSSQQFSAFGYWAEQLIAESTGKEGTGILPVEGEILAPAEHYETDRVFVRYDLTSTADGTSDIELNALEAAGHPVIRFKLQDPLAIGAEFFRWEFATAVAGAALEINPFDQPNVQENKNNTARLIKEYLEQGRLDEDSPRLSEKSLAVYCNATLAHSLEGKSGTIEELIANFLRLVRPHDYIAIMAYLQRTSSSIASLNGIRSILGDQIKTAATVGFGPRFLHSTGQFHKGGPDRGIFLQITCADQEDIAIPGAGYSFGLLKKAQALGDMQALAAHDRKVIRIHISGELSAGLQRIAQIISDSFSRKT